MRLFPARKYQTNLIQILAKTSLELEFCSTTAHFAIQYWKARLDMGRQDLSS